MVNKGYSRKETIFPLSCNSELDKDDIRGIDVYFNLLKEVLCNPRIRNIAVTGTYGIGKSSIIKSFDIQNNLPFKSKPKFLYISLGQYDNTNSMHLNNNSVNSDSIHIADITTNSTPSTNEITTPNTPITIPIIVDNKKELH